MDDGWVLNLPPRVQGLLVPPVNPVNATEAEPAEGTERVIIIIGICIILVEAIEHAGAAGREEDVKRVGTSEEGCKRRMGVSMESVVESVP